MSEFTHAGGITVRNDKGILRYLIVTAKENPSHWVLPKGHIEPGETPEQTAEREVLEEAGIEAHTLGPVGATEYQTRKQTVRVKFFLMEYVGKKGKAEDRQQRWCTYQEAYDLLSFDNLRTLLSLTQPLASKLK